MACPPVNERLRGQTPGVFVVLLIITIMPKGLGNLLAVLVGTASYLLLLIFQPQEAPPLEEEVCQKAASGCTAKAPVESASDDDEDDVVKTWEAGHASGSDAGGRGAEQAEEEEVPGDTEPPQLDESLQENFVKLKEDVRNLRTNRACFKDVLQELNQSDAEAVPAPAAPEVHDAGYQENLGDCWEWVSRGWCPKGPACKWAHPRDEDTGPVFYHSLKLAADAVRTPAAPSGDKDTTSGGGRAERAGTETSEDTTHKASAGANDPDAILTDDGF